MPGSKPKAGGVRLVNSREGIRRRFRTREKTCPSSRLFPHFSRVKFQTQGNNPLLEPPPPAKKGKNVLLLGWRGMEDALAQPAPQRSPSTTPHRNLRAPPAAPATAAPPAPVGLSSPGAGAACGSNDAPAEAAGLELSSLSRSSSAAWLSFCTILLPPAAATSASLPRPPSVRPPARRAPDRASALSARPSALSPPPLPFPLPLRRDPNARMKRAAAPAQALCQPQPQP